MRSSACDTVCPVLCPAHALLACVSLGPCPSLHRLCCGRDRFVRRLPSYYGRVRWQGVQRVPARSIATISVSDLVAFSQHWVRIVFTELVFHRTVALPVFLSCRLQSLS